MPVWRPPPGLPECEWTSVNKRQTYTNTPAAIGPSQGEECVGDAKQQQQQQLGDLHARVPLFHSFTNQEEAPPQEGAWKDVSLTKKRPVGGSPLAPARPQWIWMRVHPHILQLTPTPPTGRRQQVGNLQISISKSTPLQRHQSEGIVICLSALMI